MIGSPYRELITEFRRVPFSAQWDRDVLLIRISRWPVWGSVTSVGASGSGSVSSGGGMSP